MSTNLSKPAPLNPESLDRGHEVTDVRMKPVIWTMIGLAVVSAIIQVGLWWGMKGYAHYEARQDVPQSALSDIPLATPEPRLQGMPSHPALDREDLAIMRAHDGKILDSYGRSDMDHGFAQIPIDLAMKLVVEKNLLKARPGAPTTQSMDPFDAEAPSVTRPSNSPEVVR